MTAKKAPHPDGALFDILVAAFERQLSQEEAEAILAECGGDVRRASERCRELVRDYMRFILVEDTTHESDLVRSFEGQFLHEDAEAISAGFGGDVRRASKLHRGLTEGDVSVMTVEELIKAGKDGHDD